MVGKKYVHYLVSLVLLQGLHVQGFHFYLRQQMLQRKQPILSRVKQGNVIKRRQEAKLPVSNALWAASKLRKHSLLCMLKTEMTASSSKQTFCKKC
jgi:hypothetical protein